jgi:ferric-dicitrate binding protein FerR (iron transport regulator)
VVTTAEVNPYRVARRRRLLLLGGAALLCGAAIGVFALRAYRAPEPRLQRLADGTEIFYLSNTQVAPSSSYPQPREIRIDGEAFIRAAADAQPLVIRTRLMVLKVTGASALRVTARSSETGEEADVLSGQVEATKAYPSTQNEPDILLAGQEVMVNQTIDLQEKETADVPALRAWSNALVSLVMRKTTR